VSPSEFGFLALGIALGVTAGVALLAVVRPRSPLRPVVRVTVTPHAMTPGEFAELHRRGARFEEPTRGSPDDDAHGGLPAAAALFAPAARQPVPEAVDLRTTVPSGTVGLPRRAVGIPIVGDGPPATGPLASGRTAAIAVAERGLQPADADAPAHLTLPTHVETGPSRASLAVQARPPAPDTRPSMAPEPVAVPIVAGRAPSGRSPKPAPPDSTAAPDTCADERTRAATACAAADAARDSARRLADQLREGQRAQADLQARIEEAGALADPRRLAAEKERLHAQFTAAHGATVSADEAEAAARDWLTAVSAANKAAHDAARRIQSGTDELRRQTVALEKLDLEANGARVAAERAEDACRTAREALATCEERQRPVEPDAEAGTNPLDAHWPGGPEPSLDRQPGPGAGDERAPRILRVLRGDKPAREELVASLAAGDPSAIPVWHVRIADFVDAVTARAIEDGYIDPDEENPFWRLFSGDEQREIIEALSALGFRFDGMGGFADDRAPSARDLSLAVGYAGLDRMRIRSWPGEAALAGLFGGASVRADLWLAAEADDLSLGRMEAALAQRAAALSDLWNAWGRVRPAMLEAR
jgi:hypothetical protein